MIKWNGTAILQHILEGALICEIIHEAQGDEGINTLARGKTNNYEEIISLVKNILQLNEDQVQQLFEKKIKEFE